MNLIEFNNLAQVIGESWMNTHGVIVVKNSSQGINRSLEDPPEILRIFSMLSMFEATANVTIVRSMTMISTYN